MILCRGRAVLSVLLWLASPARASASGDLASCETLLCQAPAGEKAAECLYEVAKGTGPSRAAAARRLEQLQHAGPTEPWPSLYLGYLRWVTGKTGEAEGLYRTAIEASVRRGLPRAELLARTALSRILRDTGRVEEAGDEVERVVEIAGRSRDPFILAKAGILQANQFIALGDLEGAYLALARIEKAVKEEGSYALARDYLFPLFNVAQQTGRFHEAQQRCRRLAALAADNGDIASEAAARFGLASARRDQLSEMPEAGGREEVVALAHRSLAAARAAQRPSLEAYALWVLGSLTQGEEAAGYLERCSAVADTPKMRSHCLGTLARRLAPSDPPAAEAAIHEALGLARQAGDTLAQTSAWHERMRVSWEIGSQGVALEDSLAALDAIEALRDLQGGSARQPGLFSTWAEDYYWLSGRLLEDRRLEQAFGVVERMRSRTLIDALGLGRQPSEAVEPRALRPDFASLEKVRGALAPDEALLSFQIAPWKDLSGDFGGGSWLLVAHQGAIRVYRLPDRIKLRRAVSFFAGMFEARDGQETRSASLLYKDLLADALAELPDGIRRLVIVADDALHRLPFGALRLNASDPLAKRYEITLVPSATLWLRWRRARPAPAFTPALVLADPVSPATAKELGKLPFALTEGKSVIRRLGGGDLLVGEEASESYIKGSEAVSFGLLHLAAHAVTDEVNPERSRIYLSPGDRKQDGLLHAREIVADLDLDGKIVVLSVCESASGEILRGEGVMGLARAFFEARAHTVVASLWPLRDDDGAALFDRFYLHLSQGKSVAAALQSAQRDRMAEGAPGEAWAGVVVLGDGDRIPVPGGRRGSGVLWIAVVIVLLATVLLLWRRAAARPRRSRR